MAPGFDLSFFFLDLRRHSDGVVFYVHVQLKLNGQHIADFAHRLPKETAQFIVISGEVSISYIKFQSGGQGPHGGGVSDPSFRFHLGSLVPLALCITCRCS